MYEYIAEPLSRRDIREIVNDFRKYLVVYDEPWFPIVKMLDIMCLLFPGFNYEIVPDEELPEETHAETDIITGLIKIKESVYYRACKGEGRDRMTIAHEIGHFILVYYLGFNLTRNYSKRKLKTYEDPEWQAKCFAGELMIPKHLINGKDFYLIMDLCGVSIDAAQYQCRKYAEEDSEFVVL